MAAGTPFAAAHSLFPDRAVPPGQPAPRLSNVVFAGSGTQPGVGVPMVLISGKLAAERVTGRGPAAIGGSWPAVGRIAVAAGPGCVCAAPDGAVS